MELMKNRRLRQVISYGWKDAGEIACYPDVKKSRFSIFLDIWHSFRKHYLFSNQYKSNKFWSLDESARLVLANKLGEENRRKDNWIDVHYSDWKFLSKYTSIKWHESPKKAKQRNNAYIKHYGLGEKLYVQYGVTIICEHYSIGKIKCGEKVLFARDCDIDYTGDLFIGDRVALSEGVKIFTHNHSIDYSDKGKSKGCILTPLVIQDRAWIGARAVIMPGVGEIGRGAVISTCSYVRSKIPPYAIVMGNPAKVIGFRFTPEETVKFEEENYPADQRIPIDVLKRNYEKYYHSQWKEINHWVKSLSLQ